VLAIGKLVGNAVKAAESLATDGITIDLWDVRSCAPLDPAMIASAESADIVLTFEDGIRDGGIGSIIATQLGNTKVLTHGVPTQFISQAKPDAILGRLGLDSAGIAQAVRSALSQHSSR
jgi:1-deoxy-D-xylulose-5-phosphate synthase